MATYTQPQIQGLNPAVPSDQASLSKIDLTTLSSEQLGYFSHDQIPYLSSSFSNIQSGNITGFTGQAVSGFTESQIKSLTIGQIIKLSTGTNPLIRNLTTYQINFLSSTQIQNIDAGAFGIFTAEQINAFKSDNFGVLSVAQFHAMVNSAQLDGLFGSNQLSSTLLTTNDSNCFGSLTTGQLTAVGTNLTKLSLLQLASIASASFAVIDPSVLQLFSTTQVANITPQQFASLTASQINSLGTNVSSVKDQGISNLTTQIIDLSLNVVQALTSSQIKSVTVSNNLKSFGSKFSDAQYGYMTITPINQLQMLSQSQIQNLSEGAIQLLSTVTSGDAPMAHFSNTQIGWLSSDELSHIKKELFGILASDQINAFNSKTFEHLTLEQFGAMVNSAQLNGLFGSNHNASVLYTDASHNNCFGSLTQTQLTSIASHVTELSNAQLAVIPVNTFKQINKDVLATFSDDQVSNITPDQFAKLSAAQVNSLGSKVSRVNANGISLLVDTVIVDLSLNVVQALTNVQVPVVTIQANLQAFGTKFSQTSGNNQYGYMSGNQLALLSENQVKSLSTGTIALLSSLQDASGNYLFTSLTNANIHNLSSSQIGAIGSSVFGKFVPSQLNSFDPSQFGVLSASQFNSIMDASANISGLFGSNDIYKTFLTNSPSANCFGQITQERLANLGDNVEKLSAAQISSIPSTAFSTLTDARMKYIVEHTPTGLTRAQVQALSVSQINSNIGSAFGTLTNDASVVIPSFSQMETADASGNLVLSNDVKISFSQAQVIAMPFTYIPYMNPVNARYITLAQFTELNKAENVRVKESIPSNVTGSILNDNILSWNTNQLINLLASNITSVFPPVYQLSALPSANVSVITGESLNKLNQTQFNALSTKDISSDVIPSINASKFGSDFKNSSALVGAQTSRMTVDQVKALTGVSTSVSDLSADAAVNILNVTARPLLINFGNIASVKKEAFGQNFTNVASIDKDHAAALTPNQFKSLTNTSVANFPKDYFADLNESCFGPAVTTDNNNNIAFTQAASISSACAEKMTVNQVKKLSSVAASVEALTAATAKALLNVTDRALLVNISNFDKITYSAFSSGFTNTSSITADKASVMTVAQIQAIDSSVFKFISASTLSHFNPVAFGQGFNNVGFITVVQATAVYDASQNQISGLTASQLSNILPAAIYLLTNDVCHALTYAQAAGLSSNQIVQFTETQLSSLQTTVAIIVYGVKNDVIKPLNINVNSFNTNFAAPLFTYNKVGADEGLVYDAVVTLNMPITDVVNAFNYRLNVNNQIDLFFSKSDISVKYNYGSSVAMKLDMTQYTTETAPKTGIQKYKFPQTQWIGPVTAEAISGTTATSAITDGVPVSWDYMQYSAEKIFGLQSTTALNYFNAPYKSESDFRNAMNTAINASMLNIFDKLDLHSPNAYDSSPKLLDASLNEYYTLLDTSTVSTDENFMSYIFDYINSHQPQRFTSPTVIQLEHGVKTPYPFIVGDTLNFTVAVNSDSNQKIVGKSETVPTRVYKIVLNISAN